MADLSVIIAARNEIYLEKTIQDILKNIRGNTEIIVVLDGYLPEPRIETNDNRVLFFHFKESIGQRQSVNYGVKQSQAKFIMKLDAHCAVDEGFDVKLMQDCEYNWTVVPRMYNLDAETWLPKLRKRTDYMYITYNQGKEFRMEYFTGSRYRQEHSKPELIDDTMCIVGCCFFMHKDRYWELEGLDEAHGGWGQMGIEVSCKAWLSGGSLKVNKKTWFSHYFRGNVGFPYHLSGRAVERAREYSRDLWLNDKWSKQTRSFQWLLDKFNPQVWNINKSMKDLITVIYYTSNNETPEFEQRIIEELKKQAKDLPIISVSKKPIELGENICIGELPFNEESLLRQILAGLKKAKTQFCLAAESDFIYPPEYFNFAPPSDKQVYRYDNVWVKWINHSHFYKKYYSEGAQICGRQYWIDRIEEALAKGILPKKLFSTGLEYKYSGNPAVSFKTRNGLHYKTIMDKKVRPAKMLPYWGDCEKFL